MKYYHLAVWAQGQVKLAKVAQKSSTYDVTHKKNASPQPKNFFRVQTTRLAESFELLSGSVALTGSEKFLRKATCDPAVFFANHLNLLGCESVKDVWEYCSEIRYIVC